MARIFMESTYMNLSYTLPVLVALILVCGVFTLVEAKSSSSTQGIKWATYTDPYNRYSIEYPSKWTIQSEPVHSQTSPLLEVPLKISNSHASTLMVSEIDNKVGLSLREFTSFVQNNDFTGVPKKTVSPVSCGFAPQSNLEVCEYYQVYTYGLTEDGDKVMLYSAPNNAVFNVQFLFGPDEPLSGHDINYMLSSFRIPVPEGVGDSQTSIPPVFKTESSIPHTLQETNISPSSNNTQKFEGSVDYNNPTLGVKIKYPKDWQLAETSVNGISIIQFFSPIQNNSDVFRENINIAIEDLPTDSITLIDYSDKSISQLSTSFPRFHSIASNTVTVNGLIAVEKLYTAGKSGVDVKFRQLYTLNNNKAYVITYAAELSNYDKYSPIIQKMVDSFQIM